MENNLYLPAEDSIMLAKEVAKSVRKMLSQKKNIRVLDMGTGSGMLAKAALKAGCKKENILAADINKEAVMLMKNEGFKALKSDLFSDIKGRFDLIIFNPPYLPASKYDKNKDTCGGKQGWETAMRFIRQLGRHLTKEGIALLLLSSFTKPELLEKEIKRQKLEFEQLASGRYFFEELYVWLIKNQP